MAHKPPRAPASKHAAAHPHADTPVPVETVVEPLPPRPVPPSLTQPASPAVPQGPSNTAQNRTGPAVPFNPMGTITIATGPNPDGLRHQGLVAAQGQPGMEHVTDASIASSRAPAPKEK